MSTLGVVARSAVAITSTDPAVPEVSATPLSALSGVIHQGMAPRLPTQLRDAWIGIRTTTAMREAWEAAARADGRTLTSWLIARANGLPSTEPVLASEGQRKPRSAPRKARAKRAKQT
jgi:hypothetical protein